MEKGKWKSKRELNDLWPNNKLDINSISSGLITESNWSGVHWKDYLKLCDDYYDAGISIATEILYSGRSNEKKDAWFLSNIFMFRQAIELAIKAKIYLIIPVKPDIQKLFISEKHNVYALFRKVKNDFVDKGISKEELELLDDYLRNLEEIDVQSTVFRYPLNVKRFDEDFPRFVDVGNTLEKMDFAYNLIRSTFEDHEEHESVSLPSDSNFFTEAECGIENCYLQIENLGSPYHSIINGYFSVSEFLLTKLNSIEENFYFPALFSIRHLLELELKQLSYADNPKVNNLKFRRQGHQIYSDLWYPLESFLQEFGKENNWSTDPIKNSDEFIRDFQKIDKEEVSFRYPAGYNHEYYALNSPLDVANIFHCTVSVINFLEGCYSIFSNK